jgi:hypothetical protein
VRSGVRADAAELATAEQRQVAAGETAEDAERIALHVDAAATNRRVMIVGRA